VAQRFQRCDKDIALSEALASEVPARIPPATYDTTPRNRKIQASPKVPPKPADQSPSAEKLARQSLPQ
jgi:hypothetical protein